SSPRSPKPTRPACRSTGGASSAATTALASPSPRMPSNVAATGSRRPRTQTPTGAPNRCPPHVTTRATTCCSDRGCRSTRPLRRPGQFAGLDVHDGDEPAAALAEAIEDIGLRAAGRRGVAHVRRLPRREGGDEAAEELLEQVGQGTGRNTGGTGGYGAVRNRQ